MKTIAAVMGVPAIRPEIAANASSVSATTASAQCTVEPYATGTPAERSARARRLERTESTSMGHGRLKRLIFGSTGGIAGTVYGTIVVMATVAAGSRGAETDAGALAAIVGVTVLVLWFAHVYSHTLAESLERGRRLDRAELVSVARRELAIVAAAVAPVAALVLAALGIVSTSRRPSGSRSGSGWRR